MKKYGLLLVFSLLLVGCNKSKISYNISSNKIEGYTLSNETKNKINVDPFGTSMVLYTYFKNDKEKDNNLSNITNIFNTTCDRLHKQFDRHYYYDDANENRINNVKVINDSFGKDIKIKCDDELYELLKFGVNVTKLTNSKFNIFTGTITDFWDECFTRAYNFEDFDQFDPSFNTARKTLLENYVNEIPLTSEDIDAQLTFFDDTKEVMFNKLTNQSDDYHPLISVGGFAKGMGTDYIKQTLLDNNYSKCLINSGSSSISIVSKPDFIIDSKEGVSISTKNPNHNEYLTTSFPKTIAQYFKFKEAVNISTSSNASYSKHYVVTIDDNKVLRYHIFNPSTGYSEQYHTQISVVSKTFSNAYLDCFTTALMNMSVSEGMSFRNELLTNFNGYDLSIYWLDWDANSNGIIHASDHNYSFTLGENVSVIYEG